MKTKFLIAFAFVATLFSCSSNDNSSDDSGTGIYTPLVTGDYWTYKVIGDTTSDRDSLYVGNDSIIDTKTYKRMKTLKQPVGFYSNSLNKNGLRKEGGILKIKGTFGIAGLPVAIDIPLNDFIIFKETAANNQDLSSTSGTIEQTLGTYPLTINYTMKSTSVESLPTFTTPAPDSKTYTDVKKVKTVMNMKVKAQILPAPLPATTVMNSQDVVVSYQYYSKDIGMVYANTVTHYELATAIPGSTIPTTGNQTQNEFLDTYHIN